MLKKTAITLALTMCAGPVLAAGADNASSMTNDSSTSSGQQDTQNMSGGSDSARRLFQRLDTNHDGTLSQSEASANPRVSELYDSMNTNDVIEDSAKNSHSNGISADQFEAGMQAASHGGVVGQPVSGGQTYTLMKDGSKRAMSDNSMSGGTMSANSMGQAQQNMDTAGRSMGDSASRMSSGSQNTMSNMRNRGSQMESQGSRMRNEAGSGMSQMNNQAQNTMSGMQNRAAGQSDRMRNSATPSANSPDSRTSETGMPNGNGTMDQSSGMQMQQQTQQAPSSRDRVDDGTQ